MLPQPLFSTDYSVYPMHCNAQFFFCLFFLSAFQMVCGAVLKQISDNSSKAAVLVYVDKGKHMKYEEGVHMFCFSAFHVVRRWSLCTLLTAETRNARSLVDLNDGVLMCVMPQLTWCPFCAGLILQCA